REVEDDAIREVVRLQKELGPRTTTDGEYRRVSWHMDFMVTFHNEEADIEVTPSGLRVTDPVRFEHPIFGGGPHLPEGNRAQHIAGCGRRPHPEVDHPAPRQGHHPGGRARGGPPGHPRPGPVPAR